MSDQKKRIFVSYSHADEAWCELFRRQLKSVHDPLEYDIWIDAGKIEVGSQWRDRIEQGLADTDVALLLISDNFLSSDFIRNKEQAPLLARRDAGMLLVPVLVGCCPWEQIGWIEATQMRPTGGKALEQIGRATSPKAKQVAMELVNELTRLLKKSTPGAAAPAAGAATDWAAGAARLVAQTLLQEQDDAARAPLAARLVDRIGAISGLRGPALYQAVRVFIEFHLLRADAPTAPRALLASCAALPNDKAARVLIDNLKRGSATGDYRDISIGVSSLFFMHAREREALWQAYFETLHAQPGELALGEEQIGSLAQVEVQWGFLAPQFLVAGLMSRFDDDWRPVLGVYRQSLPKAGARDGGFANLQASQWNCWLVWGPSVPICRCEQWRGHVAFQYGYGDENNSLPLLDLRPEGEPSPLDTLAVRIARDGQGAGVARLTGRLRWGPYLLRGGDGDGDDDEGPDRDAGDDLDDLDPDDADPEQPPPRPTRKLRLADAQSALLCGDGLAHANHSDGLLLELIDLPPAAPARAYFSAYFWLMFLVAGPLQSDAGPRLLWRRRWPDWPESTGRPGERGAVRAAQLWRDLLPVFVHANVADAQALAIQRRTLVESALATLRSVWRTREQNFDPDDVAAGIRFHLVCGSDYSGCGEPIRYLPQESLCTLLRARLADEPDRDFAQAVALPADDESAATRPWGLAGYLSSCHLNELVADYFEHVARLNEEKASAARRR